LAANKLFAPGGLADFARQGGAASWGGGLVAREKLEGKSEQCIAGEEGGGFVELLMGGGVAAPEVIIIHARQVIVDQRIRMQAFEGNGRGEGLDRGAACVGGGQN